MLITLIAAVARNGTIGKNNDLPWRLRDDMRFFVSTTRGHVVITGRKNFEAMGRPLPHRVNLVVSRNAHAHFEGCTTVTSVEEALVSARRAGETEAFIIGGGEIYARALPYAHRIYRTLVLADVAGDAFFPHVDFSEWERAELLRHEPDQDNEHPFVIERWDRHEAPMDLPA